MGLISKDSGGSGDFEPIPPGTYPARCVTVADLGVQQTPYGGKEKVYIGFEVPSVRVEWEKDGQKHEGPAFIGMRYTNSIHEKSILGQHLTSWRGKAFTEQERQGFDLFNVLGAACLISVVHNHKGDKTYANVQSVMRMPQGMPPAEPESEQIAYSPMDQATSGNLDKLPEWLQKVVRAGWQMADGSNVIGSAQHAQQAAGGPVAAGQPPPQYQPPAQWPAAPGVEQQLATGPNGQQQPADPRAAALATAHGGAATVPTPDDYFDDDIPF